MEQSEFGRRRAALRFRPVRGAHELRSRRLVRVRNGGMALEAVLPSGEPVLVPISGCAPPRTPNVR